MAFWSRFPQIAGAVAVAAGVPLVVTEGNYLLLWPDVRALLDEVWYLDLDDDEPVLALAASEQGRRHDDGQCAHDSSFPLTPV